MQKDSRASVIRTYWRHTKKFPGLLCICVSGVLIQQIGYVISPLFLKDFFNLLTTSANVGTYAAATPLAVFAIIQCIAWIGGRMEMGGGLTIIAHVSANLVEEAFAYLLRHSHHFFSSSFSGSLVRRVSRYSASYERLYYSFQTSVVPSVLYIVGISAVLLHRNFILGSLLVFWVIVFIAVQWFMIKWQQPLRIKRAEEDSNMTATLADSISNQHTVALFAGNTYEEGLLHKAVTRFKAALLKTWRFDLIMYGVQGILGIVIQVGLLWIAFLYERQGILTVGDLVLIQAYVFGLFNSVWGLGREFRNIFTAIADGTEMVETLALPHEITDASQAKALHVAEGKITCTNVSFYFHKERPVLQAFSLDVRGGEKIALVGPSGAGKSTITKLLLRLYDVKNGAIEIDGQNIAEVTQDSLHNAIAFVPQEPILFHRTLMENIRYGKRDATDDEVYEASRKAHCHEFISALPDGYNTFVGERGVKLSGGERQRVAIARAILKNAPILLLDEATSSLDSESESFIQDALTELMKGKTVIVIAHRLSTIMKMDRIVVLQDGSIVAEGTHEQLLQNQGLYKKLWSIQAGGFIVDKDEEQQGEPALA